MTLEELLFHRDLELLRAAGKIRKHGNNQKARLRTRERSVKLAQAQRIIEKEVNKKMDKIKAKFRCTEVAKTEPFYGVQADFLYTAKLQPVTTGSEENKKFYAATPGGNISLTSILPDYFVPGKEYYVEFTPAD
ncbi:MAG TPA: hypothetical protein VGB45_05185 [Abditibacterium sp.]|jgi:hypothetical protein